MLFCRSKSSNVLVTHYFYGGILTQYFVSCVHVRFYFSLPIIFTLLAAGISHCLTAALIFMFFFLQNSSLPFSITRSSSFSVIQVSVNIKNNVEKDTTLLFFLSKRPGGHAISFQIKPWVAFGLPYLLIELFYIGMPVVRTESRSVYGHMITKLLTHGALLRALRAPELRKKRVTQKYRNHPQNNHWIDNYLG